MSKAYERLIESLSDKIMALDEILSICDDETDKLLSGIDDIDEIGVFTERHQELINKINQLNTNSDVLLKLVSEEKDTYDAEQKAHINELISTVNDKANKVHIAETKLKTTFAEFISTYRKQIGNDRKGAKAAMNYYRVQNNLDSFFPQFMDDKK